MNVNRWDYENNYIDPNIKYNIALYCPCFNRIVFVYDDYDVLKKLKLILSSKIRLEILNLSKCCNIKQLTNEECIDQELKFIKSFGLTYSTYQRSETDFILDYSVLTDKNVIPVRNYLFFCFYIINEFYFHKTKYGMKYNYEELLLIKDFYKNVLKEEQAQKFFEEELNVLHKQLYFYNKLEEIVFFESNKNECLKEIKKFIGNEFNYIFKNHHIELLVMDSYLRRNIIDD
jgi:hypothetical protein